MYASTLQFSSRNRRRRGHFMFENVFESTHRIIQTLVRWHYCLFSFVTLATRIRRYESADGYQRCPKCLNVNIHIERTSHQKFILSSEVRAVERTQYSSNGSMFKFIHLHSGTIRPIGPKLLFTNTRSIPQQSTSCF